MLLRRDDGHEIDTIPGRLDRTQIQRWLSTDAYWALGRTEATMATAVANSTCYGVYDPGGRQVGFARVVTDGATFAWICDVYIERSARGRGLGTWLARSIAADLNGRGLPRVVLATADAHDVYRRAGFTEVAHPSMWMEIDRRTTVPPARDVATPSRATGASHRELAERGAHGRPPEQDAGGLASTGPTVSR